MVYIFIFSLMFYFHGVLHGWLHNFSLIMFVKQTHLGLVCAFGKWQPRCKAFIFQTNNKVMQKALFLPQKLFGLLLYNNPTWISCTRYNLYMCLLQGLLMYIYFVHGFIAQGSPTFYNEQVFFYLLIELNQSWQSCCFSYDEIIQIVDLESQYSNDIESCT